MNQIDIHSIEATSVDVSAWGSEPPQFIQLLADAVAESSRASVARKIGVSRSSVSTLLANRYPSPSTRKIEAKVLEALGRVACPTMGDIATNRCTQIRNRPFMSSHPQAIAQFRACANCSYNPKRRSEEQ